VDNESIEDSKNRDLRTCLWSNSIVVLLMLGIAGVTYLGASMRPETTFSDIRTIAIVLPSLLLPFLLVSGRLASTLNARKVLVGLLIVLMIFASLRTSYEVYPKSLYDPINVVEDDRLGLSSIYQAGQFVTAHYAAGIVVGDYKVLNRVQYLIPSPQYRRHLLGDAQTLVGASEFCATKAILVYDMAGVKYPSLYHTAEEYDWAEALGMTSNRLYDNGVVLIADLSGKNC